MTETTKRILAMKERAGLSDHKLEMLAGLKPAFIQAWKNGKKNSKGVLAEVSPSADSVAAIARCLNISADYLLCLTDEPKPLNETATSAVQVKSSTALTDKLAEEYKDLFADDEFVKVAKVYASTKDAIVKGILVGYFLATAKANGVDVSIVGY